MTLTVRAQSYVRVHAELTVVLAIVSQLVLIPLEKIVPPEVEPRVLVNRTPRRRPGDAVVDLAIARMRQLDAELDERLARER
jgi:hypothetical protein